MKSFEPNSWIVPQPVLIIGTYDADGKANAMNAAWGGQWDQQEIMISLGSHATTDNLKRCGEFTVAFGTKDTMAACDYVGIVSARKNPDKMSKTGWKSSKAKCVEAPIFDCFPMTLECKIKEKIGETAEGYNLVAEIVNIQVDEAYLGTDGKPDVEKMGLIAYEPVHHTYMEIGASIGQAFSIGKKL